MNVLRDALARVPEGCRLPSLDARVSAFCRVLARLAGLSAAVRAEGATPRVSGLELVAAEGLRVVEDAGCVEGYGEVAGVVLGVVAGLTGIARG